MPPVVDKPGDVAPHSGAGSPSTVPVVGEANGAGGPAPGEARPPSVKRQTSSSKPPPRHPVSRPLAFDASSSITAQSSDSRDGLKRDLLKRQKSLTPRELDFLEMLTVYGDDGEIECARTKLADTDLFFDRTSDEENEESPTTASVKGSSSSAISGADMQEREDEEQGLSAASHSVPRPKIERCLSASSRTSDNNIEMFETSSGKIQFQKHVSHSPAVDSLRNKYSRRQTWASTTSIGSVEREQHLRNRRVSKVHNDMWRAHERGIGITTAGSRTVSSALARRPSVGESMNSFKGRKGSVSRSGSVLRRDNSFLSDSTIGLLVEGGPTDRPGEGDIFRAGGSMSSIGYASGEGSAPSQGHPLKNLRKYFASQPIELDLGNGLIVGGSGDVGASAGSGASGNLAGSGSTNSHRRNVSFKEGNVQRSKSLRAIRRPSRQRNLSGGSYNSLVSLGSVGSRRGYSRLESDLSSIPPILHAHPIRSESILSIPPLKHANRVTSDSGISSLNDSSFVAHTLETIASPRKEGKDENDDDSDDAREKAKAAFAARAGEQHQRTKEGQPVWSAPGPPLPPAPSELPPVSPALLYRRKSERQAGMGPQKPVLLRKASRSSYQGEGMEVTELAGSNSSISVVVPVENARKYRSMVSTENTPQSSVVSQSNNSIYDSSFETGNTNPADQGFIIMDDIKRSLSADDMASLMLGGGGGGGDESANDLFSSIADIRIAADDASWDLASESEEPNYDAWNVLMDEYAVGYGADGSLNFLIFGTSADDESSKPHVLSPPLMESLQSFLPYSVSEDNFWLKYSLVRDGASLHTLLQNIRGAQHTIIAMETSDGEVFGSFTSTPWRKSWSYFGSGESFLWRMRQTRKTPCHSIIDQARLESELDVFPWTGENSFVQFCTSDKIAVGGAGSENVDGKTEEIPPPAAESESYGFGLAVESDLLYGTSSSCTTFASPPLSREHPDGSPFMIINMEVWTLTPCASIEEAEKLELGRLFLEKNKS